MAPENHVIRVKICGITCREDAEAAVEAGAHALGFVFYPPSPRYVSASDAASIIADLPPFVTAVGLFVNRPRQEVEAAVAISGIHVIQLHGHERPQMCVGYSRPVIKAFRFSAESPLPSLSDYPVSGMLIDAAVPGKWGGSGEIADWNLLNQCLSCAHDGVRSRLILAGGLNAANVKRAVKLVRPFGVDVSSGVEKAPGRKSAKMMKEFIDAVRDSERERHMARSKRLLRRIRRPVRS